MECRTSVNRGVDGVSFEGRWKESVGAFITHNAAPFIGLLLSQLRANWKSPEASLSVFCPLDEAKSCLEGANGST